MELGVLWNLVILTGVFGERYGESLILDRPSLSRSASFVENDNFPFLTSLERLDFGLHEVKTSLIDSCIKTGESRHYQF